MLNVVSLPTMTALTWRVQPTSQPTEYGLQICPCLKNTSTCKTTKQIFYTDTTVHGITWSTSTQICHPWCK